MSYTSSVSSGGQNPYDVLQYQRMLAAQQSASSSQSSTGFSTAATGSSSSTSASSSASSSGSAAAPTDLTSMLSSQLSSLLLQLQNQSSGPSGSAASSSTTQPATSIGQLLSTDSSNGNAPITQADFEQAFAGGTNTAAADQVFAKLDKNGDGTIDQSEAQTAVQPAHHGGHHHHHGGGASATQDPLSTDSSDPSSSQSTDPLAQLLEGDASGTTTGSTSTSTSTTTGTSGQVSQSDFETALSGKLSTSQADQLFAKLDKNGDGTIDQSEAQNALKHRLHAQEAQGMQSPFGTASNSGGQGGSASNRLSGSGLLLFAQQMGQAA